MKLSAAAMPIVMNEIQAKMLPPNMVKTISEENYSDLPIMNVLTRKKSIVMALGGQVSDERPMYCEGE